MDKITEYESSGVVLDVKDGLCEILMELPISFQGRYSGWEISRASDDDPVRGPFEVVVSLYSDHIQHQQMSNKKCSGYSFITVPKEINQSKLHAMISNSRSNVSRHVTVSLLTNEEDILIGLKGHVDVDDIDTSIDVVFEAIVTFVDAISFHSSRPLKISKVSVFRNDSIIYEYGNIPYSNYVIDEDSLHRICSVPKVLSPLLRLFREAVEATSPVIRLLCLFFVYEGYRNLRKKQTMAIRGSGLDFQRKKIRLLDDELTKQYFPLYAGKSLDYFMSSYVEKLRDNIVHMNTNEHDKLLVNTSRPETLTTIDCANYILISSLREAIIEEYRVNNYLAQQK